MGIFNNHNAVRHLRDRRREQASQMKQYRLYIERDEKEWTVEPKRVTGACERMTHRTPGTKAARFHQLLHQLSLVECRSEYVTVRDGIPQRSGNERCERLAVP